MDAMPRDDDDLPGRLLPVLRRLTDDAARLDRDALLPDAVVELLHGAGALAAPLPRRLGGLGLGTEPNAAQLACAVLRQIGRASMPLGRLYEGHLNALRLILLYATPVQAETAAADARAGHLFAVWIAENSGRPVRIDNGALVGAKSFASGAGAVTRALVTAQDERGERMVLAAFPRASARIGARPDLHGMRGAATASVDLTGLPAPAEALIGGAGDYMRQPEITLGSWRPLAVLSGGASALVDALRSDLAGRDRAAHPDQRARLAACLVAEETARLWIHRAADLAETRADADAAGYVQLARAAVDAACTSAIQLAQRSAGLAAFARPHPIERLCRDLATYLRQPALDEAIDEAAAYFLDRPLPE